MNPSSSGKAARGSGKKGPGKSGGRLGDVGHLLSATYKDTLDEAIPPDLLDLLGKLD